MKSNILKNLFAVAIALIIVFSLSGSYLHVTQIEHKRSESHLIDSLIQKEIANGLKNSKATIGMAVIYDFKNKAIVNMSYLTKRKNQIVSKNELSESLIKSHMMICGNMIYPITISIALEKGIVNKNDSIDCENYVENGIKVHDAKQHKNLTPEGILKEKSNIGFAKICDLMNKINLEEEYGMLGLNYKSKGKSLFINAWSMVCNPIELIKAYSILFDISSNEVNEAKNGNHELIKNALLGRQLFIDNNLNEKFEKVGFVGSTFEDRLIGKSTNVVSSIIGYSSKKVPNYLVMVVMKSEKGKFKDAKMHVGRTYLRILDALENNRNKN